MNKKASLNKPSKRLFKVTRAVITVDCNEEAQKRFDDLMQRSGFVKDSLASTGKNISVTPPFDDTLIVLGTEVFDNQVKFELFRLWPNKSKRDIDNGYEVIASSNNFNKNADQGTVNGRGSDVQWWEIYYSSIDQNILDMSVSTEIFSKSKSHKSETHSQPPPSRPIKRPKPPKKAKRTPIPFNETQRYRDLVRKDDLRKAIVLANQLSRWLNTIELQVKFIESIRLEDIEKCSALGAVDLNDLTKRLKISGEDIMKCGENLLNDASANIVNYSASK